MPWLADLVESSEGSLDVLPVQCLCEFLLHDVSTEMTSNSASHESPHQASKHVKKLKKQVGLGGLKTWCGYQGYVAFGMGIEA